MDSVHKLTPNIPSKELISVQNYRAKQENYGSQALGKTGS